MVKRIIMKSYLGLVLLFMYLPIVVLIVFSFNKSKSRGNWSGFTLKWYGELFQNSQIMDSLYNTLLLALISSVVAVIIGTFAAIGIHNMKKFKKSVVMNLTYLPVLNPDIVTGVSLMIMFVFIGSLIGLKMGFLTMLLAHITFNIPYVILSVLPKLKQMNKHLYEAALDLGATSMYALRKVIMPEIMPGIISGFLMAFTLSIDDFVISYFTAGSGVSNLSITIYSMARTGVKPTINALSTLMFVSVLLLLILINIRASREEKRKRQYDA
ncbi:inner membrane ABC transporter permease protein YdcV [Ruminiclostridium hungatei]|uniref:Inner membrane ABC transporter permease protein YdcV n=1 Tax=Ruminiclostridium hungatei TaxID=48256 RepID=A0A1V4SGQ3_RUMHU|nr:ABC transporter permease [Ruminiclostridium hungatei]OPX42913.1 inner membrane ABC transporter permease protein YdcV [Ruminiclostridium hungatei]